MVHHIQDNLKVVKSRQESYANKWRRPLEFEVQDHVYLRCQCFLHCQDTGWSRLRILVLIWSCELQSTVSFIWVQVPPWR
jgi:hypothetical protein